MLSVAKPFYGLFQNFWQIKANPWWLDDDLFQRFTLSNNAIWHFLHTKAQWWSNVRAMDSVHGHATSKDIGSLGIKGSVRWWCSTPWRWLWSILTNTTTIIQCSTSIEICHFHPTLWTLYTTSLILVPQVASKNSLILWEALELDNCVYSAHLRLQFMRWNKKALGHVSPLSSSERLLSWTFLCTWRALGPFKASIHEMKKRHLGHVSSLSSSKRLLSWTIGCTCWFLLGPFQASIHEMKNKGP